MSATDPAETVEFNRAMSEKILALGGIPITTDLQSAVATNLLFRQLLGLLSSVAGTTALYNQFIGQASINGAGGVGFQGFPYNWQIDAAQLPAGGMLEIEWGGTLSNNSGGPVGTVLIFDIGNAEQLALPVAIANGVSAFFTAKAQLQRIGNLIKANWKATCTDGPQILLDTDIGAAARPLAFPRIMTVGFDLVSGDAAVIANLEHGTVRLWMP